MASKAARKKAQRKKQAQRSDVISAILTSLGSVSAEAVPDARILCERVVDANSRMFISSILAAWLQKVYELPWLDTPDPNSDAVLPYFSFFSLLSPQQRIHRMSSLLERVISPESEPVALSLPTLASISTLFEAMLYEIWIEIGMPGTEAGKRHIANLVKQIKEQQEKLGGKPVDGGGGHSHSAAGADHSHAVSGGGHSHGEGGGHSHGEGGGHSHGEGGGHSHGEGGGHSHEAGGGHSHEGKGGGHSHGAGGGHGQPGADSPKLDLHVPRPGKVERSHFFTSLFEAMGAPFGAMVQAMGIPIQEVMVEFSTRKADAATKEQVMNSLFALAAEAVPPVTTESEERSDSERYAALSTPWRRALLRVLEPLFNNYNESREEADKLTLPMASEGHFSYWVILGTIWMFSLWNDEVFDPLFVEYIRELVPHDTDQVLRQALQTQADTMETSYQGNYSTQSSAVDERIIVVLSPDGQHAQLRPQFFETPGIVQMQKSIGHMKNSLAQLSMEKDPDAYFNLAKQVAFFDALSWARSWHAALQARGRGVEVNPYNVSAYRIDAVKAIDSGDIGSQFCLPEGPFWQRLSPTAMRQMIRCTTCLKYPTEECKLKVCSRCFVHRYCSAECQRKDWPNHKLICKLLLALHKRSEELSHCC